MAPREVTELVVTIEDTLGCTVSDSAFILISDEFPFYVPNAFAPESPRIQNAVFRPFFTNKVAKIHAMRVFTRWGELVYERRDFPIYDESIGWDGTHQGRVLDAGVYVFALEVEFINGDTRRYTGDVMLMR